MLNLLEKTDIYSTDLKRLPRTETTNSQEKLLKTNPIEDAIRKVDFDVLMPKYKNILAKRVL